MMSSGEEKNPESFEPCPQCGRSGRPIFLEQGYHALLCEGCGFCYIHPRLTHEDAADYYDREPAEISDDKLKPLPNQEIARLEIVRSVGATAPVLEVGSGYGAFLKYLGDNGYSATGVEINSHQREFAASHGLRVHPGLDEVGGSFNTVCLWNVLEHIVDYKGMLRRLNELTAPGGRIILSVPNLRYTLIKLWLVRHVLGEARFSAINAETYNGLGLFSPREHINHFSAAVLKDALEEAGFAGIRFLYMNPFRTSGGSRTKSRVRTAQWLYEGIFAHPLFVISGGRAQINSLLVAMALKP